MPELPEVETTRTGIAPHLVGQTVQRVTVRAARLRLPIPAALAVELPGQVIRAVERRGKYLLLRTDQGTVIMHLGMSGSLRVLPSSSPVRPHDHVEIFFGDGLVLRMHDPRRFGVVLWTPHPPLAHPLLCALGPEPLENGFTGEYLYQRSRGRTAAVQSFLMDQHTVVGVGNIYAAESLFLAGIHPMRGAGSVEEACYTRLVSAIHTVLHTAIAQGGTTLRDFYNASGQPGYFQQSLQVYGRAGAACPRCHSVIRRERLGQRSTFYCADCQH